MDIIAGMYCSCSLCRLGEMHAASARGTSSANGDATTVNVANSWVNTQDAHGALPHGYSRLDFAKQFPHCCGEATQLLMSNAHHAQHTPSCCNADRKRPSSQGRCLRCKAFKIGQQRGSTTRPAPNRSNSDEMSSSWWQGQATSVAARSRGTGMDMSCRPCTVHPHKIWRTGQVASRAGPPAGRACGGAKQPMPHPEYWHPPASAACNDFKRTRHST